MFFETLGDYAANLPETAGKVLVVAIFLGAFWHLLNLITPFDDTDELFRKNNAAYLVQRLALSAALVIGTLQPLTADYSDGATSYWAQLGILAMESAWVLVALLVARLVVDFVVLWKVNNTPELLGGNMAVAIVEAGFYLGFGFLLNGSLEGSAPTVLTGLASTVVFGVLGLALTVGVYFLHELVTPYKLHAGIARGALPAAFETGGLLLGVSIVVREGVAGDFTGWGVGLAAFFATAIIAVVLLYVIRWVIDRLILLNRSIRVVHMRNEYVAAALLAGLLVVMAFPIAFAIRSTL